EQLGVSPGEGSIKHVEFSGPASVSFEQERLWFLHRLDPSDASYNEHWAVRLQGELNVGALESSLNRVIERHEILRTYFIECEGSPRQIVAPVLSLRLSVEDWSNLSRLAIDEKARQRTLEEAGAPFDLSRLPLIRCCLFKIDAREHLLLLTLHHIVIDGWSYGVLVNELAALYSNSICDNGPGLCAPPIQYRDYAEWQRLSPGPDEIS